MTESQAPTLPPPSSMIDTRHNRKCLGYYEGDVSDYICALSVKHDAQVAKLEAERDAIKADIKILHDRFNQDRLSDEEYLKQLEQSLPD